MINIDNNVRIIFVIEKIDIKFSDCCISTSEINNIEVEEYEYGKFCIDVCFCCDSFNLYIHFKSGEICEVYLYYNTTDIVTENSEIKSFKYENAKIVSYKRNSNTSYGARIKICNMEQKYI